MAATSIARPPVILADDQPEPLVVRPRVAWRLLDCGNAYGYRLIASGELEFLSRRTGAQNHRRIIDRYIKRRLADGRLS